jgi:hypothetical protein
MREHLIAFIRATIAANETDRDPRYCYTIHDAPGGPSLQFGYGYFDMSKAVYRARDEDDRQELSIEEAVDRFIDATGVKR